MIVSRLIRLTAMLLVSALPSNSVALAAKKPVDPAVMKARIQARGVGQGVRVTLADTTEVKGLIVAVGEHSFAVKAKKADQPREIEYTQITGVYRDKLTRGQDVAITVGVVAGAIVIISVVLLIKFDHAKF
jgi:hypothetical protein